MRLKTGLTGSEFVNQVSNSIGEKLRFGEWIALLFDVFNSSGENEMFNDLSFEAKSFQKLKRMLATGISDEAAKKKIELEIGATLKRFSSLLERGASYLASNERKEFLKQFLDFSSPSFDNVIALSEDFSKIKDFYLMERDSRRKS